MLQFTCSLFIFLVKHVNACMFMIYYIYVCMYDYIPINITNLSFIYHLSITFYHLSIIYPSITYLSFIYHLSFYSSSVHHVCMPIHMYVCIVVCIIYLLSIHPSIYPTTYHVWKHKFAYLSVQPINQSVICLWNSVVTHWAASKRGLWSPRKWTPARQTLLLGDLSQMVMWNENTGSAHQSPELAWEKLEPRKLGVWD